MTKTRQSIRKNKLSHKAQHIRVNNKIRIFWNEEVVSDLMNKNGFDKYVYINSEEVRVESEFGYWKIEHDGKVVSLYHDSKYTQVGKKVKDKWHIQNVFFNLNSCLNSIKEHERFIKNKR